LSCCRQTGPWSTVHEPNSQRYAWNNRRSRNNAPVTGGPATQWQDVAVPSQTAPRPASIGRRDFLAGFGRAAAGMTLLAVTVSACGEPAPPPVDPLAAQLDSATADAAMARAAATAAAPDLVAALTQVASERAEHARVLAVEIARAAGGPAPTDNTPTTTTTTTTGAASPPPPPPSVDDVIAALRRSADSAGQLAPTLQGYRAGVMGSIAASCTTSHTVGLGRPEAS
jgi:hypothetical protein